MKNVQIKNLVAATVCCMAAWGAQAQTLQKADDNQSSAGCEREAAIYVPDRAVQNLRRAMQICDSAIAQHFAGDEMSMSRYYNPFTGERSDERGSVWMYTSAVEAVNAVMHSLKSFADRGRPEFYNQYFEHYLDLLKRLYENIDYYLGTFTLVSYTQTRAWWVYGVNRGAIKGQAKVEGIENVYDDQMWLVRELLESFKLTGRREYLLRAEYLTEYILDGWDCSRLPSGEESGGITWGPGYVSKHACSNAPIVSPLVWLYELYSASDDQIEFRFIDSADKRTRRATKVNRGGFYLDFARKIYAWQQKNLLRADGVYDDMMGGCAPAKPVLETIDGALYKCGIVCRDRVGPPFTYNSGSMLSAGVDLFRVTGEGRYLDESKTLADSSFSHFAELGATKADYYTYNVRGFRNWFNGVLMRSYFELFPFYRDTRLYLESFQRNLDHGYDNFFHKGFLPSNLLTGWRRSASDNRSEAMFSFAFAAEYAILSRYELLLLEP